MVASEITRARVPNPSRCVTATIPFYTADAHFRRPDGARSANSSCGT